MVSVLEHLRGVAHICWHAPIPCVKGPPWASPLPKAATFPSTSKPQPDRGRGRARLGRAIDHRPRIRPGRQRTGDRREQEGPVGSALRVLQQPAIPRRSIQHEGDNLTGEGDGDDEVINVDLKAVPPNVTNIFFPVSIHEAELRGQSFGQVTNAFIRVVDRATGNELVRYDLTEDASAETAMTFGELYRHNGGMEVPRHRPGLRVRTGRYRPRLRRQHLTRLKGFRGGPACPGPPRCSPALQ